MVAGLSVWSHALKDWSESLGPSELRQLGDPAFLEHLRSITGGRSIKPDAQDYESDETPWSKAETADLHRRARVRKLLRIYREWKATQN
jgi:hypothetical protein